jgi:hypothetical protein
MLYEKVIHPLRKIIFLSHLAIRNCVSKHTYYLYFVAFTYVLLPFKRSHFPLAFFFLSFSFTVYPFSRPQYHSFSYK